MKSIVIAAACVGLILSGGCQSPGVLATKMPEQDELSYQRSQENSAQLTGMSPIAVPTGSSPYTQASALQTGINGNLAADLSTNAPAIPNRPDAPKATDAPAPAQRVVIYSAGLRVVVVSVSDTVQSIRKLVAEQGGYVDELTSSVITLRIPAAKFDATVAQLEKLGEIVDRNIKAQDITEQMVDLKIRLDNAENTRQRLLEILKGATKTEDTLKIEQELMRVTEIIEGIKGKIRFFESQAAMSTIRVELNSPQTQVAQRQGLGIPFFWVEKLGDGLLAGHVQQSTHEPGIFGSGPSFKPPAGFVRYFQNDDLTEAMDAGDLRLKVQERDNIDKGDMQFWARLSRRVLVESRSVAISGEKVDGDFASFTGTREIGGQKFAYALYLKRSRNHIITFEAWGPADQFEAAKAAIDVAGRSIDPR